MLKPNHEHIPIPDKRDLKIQKNVQKWVKISFPDHGVNRKVVDNVENYLYMKFQPKLMRHSREKGQKPDFLKNCL